MAQEILEMSDNENVTGIAKTIMESQQYEITAMTELLAQVQAS
jgi:uncharacterized protein (DUF305 family)